LFENEVLKTIFGLKTEEEEEEEEEEVSVEKIT